MTTAYDTRMEPVADQVRQKGEELLEAFPNQGACRFSLYVVDDGEPDFADQVQAGFRALPASLRVAGRLCRVGFERTAPDQKGAALRRGIRAALADVPDVVCYLNLNLKVDARAVGRAVRVLGQEGFDVVVGSRARRDGGLHQGAGLLGRTKSRVYNEVVTRRLPPLAGIRDVNAPLKLMRRSVAERVAEYAQLDSVAFDCEWMLIFLEAGARIGRIPIHWRQREGSHPPYGLVTSMLRDVERVRAAWLAGRYRSHLPSNPSLG